MRPANLKMKYNAEIKKIETNFVLFTQCCAK
jgi:hypothetical protein